MNKQKFIEFVENPGTIREKDTDILAELARNYPYSSLVHIMLAKAQRNTANSRSSLANAALYIPDRTVLKSIMEDELAPIPSSNKTDEAEPQVQPTPSTAEHPQTESNQADHRNFPSSSLNKEPEGTVAGVTGKQEISNEAIPEQEMAEKRSVFEELQENLQKLKEQRDRFENPTGAPETPPTTVENQESKISLSSEPAELIPTKPYRLPERLQEIVENTEEKTIDDPKRIEQISLIDNFIRNSASISRKYRSVEAPEEQPDLTGNTHFTPPDLVTENLAQIMVRQGKTEKAIDIYEKLVLKYPQKKAYFASCIEKLKTSD